MGYTPFPNSGTLGEFGLTETCGYDHGKKRRKKMMVEAKPKPKRKPRDEEYEREMAQAADEAAEDDEDDEDDEDEHACMAEGKGPEIHSAKAHRCVDKVMAKGHDESSAWAICTTSIGTEGVYAKGHGGSARPKRKVAERAAYERAMAAEAEALVQEANDCHLPAGSPQGGQFCSTGGGGAVSSGSRLPAAFAAAQAAFARLPPVSRTDRTVTQLMPTSRKQALKQYGEMYRTLQGFGKLSTRALRRQGILPPSAFVKRPPPGKLKKAVDWMLDWGPAAQDVWW